MSGQLRTSALDSCPRAVRLLLAVVIVAAGCHTTRQLSQEDWGALGGDEEITVVTHSDVRHELTSFQFLTTGVIGQTEQGETQIPLDSIAFVELREPNTAGTVLTVLGAGTAVGILIALGESPVVPEPTGSCPFVYSFDGEEYRFDSETFAGAIARGLDRTDFDNLEHLRAVDGRYRIRLTNERPETQYTDEIRLMVVDHPAHVEVIPDRTGAMHTVSGLRPPRAALDPHGRDVTSEVSEADEVFWVSTIEEDAALTDPASLRDGLVLTFARPEGSRSARLVVHARNTELAPFALQTFLELQGEDLFSWYLRVADDPSLRERIRGWVQREGMLHVSVLRDGQWVLQDALLDVGPAISKSQVVQLDLEGQLADTVVVKVESARGLWSVDRIGLDAGPELEQVVREIGPSRATDAQGRDLIDLIADTDERYYATTEGAVADIEFEVPEGPPEGWNRSVVLKSRGFYYLYVSRDGPGDPELADRILDEPFTGNRYILDQWRSGS